MLRLSSTLRTVRNRGHGALAPSSACLLHSAVALGRARVIPLGTAPASAAATAPLQAQTPHAAAGPVTISIDRSGLLGMAHTEQPVATPEELARKSPSTPMVDELRAQIKVRGPLSVSDYMFQCLQNQQFGYYTSHAAHTIIGGKGDDNIAAAATATAASTDDAESSVDLAKVKAAAAEASARGGDFITSPELGQIFGEMIGVWVVQTWESLGRPARWQLLELGPGRGTLASDVLRTIARFPQAAQGLALHLCETSHTMRDEQVRKLRVRNIRRENLPQAELSAAEVALQAAAKAGLASLSTPAAEPPSSATSTAATPGSSPFTSSSVASAAASGPVDDFTKSEVLLQSMIDARKTPDQTMQGELRLADLTGAPDAPASSSEADQVVPVHWHTKASQVPASAEHGPLIVLAHEFLDALPVYQFQLTDRGWCEKLIDIDEGPGPHHLRFVLSAQPTLASRTFLPASRFPPSEARIGSAIEIGAAGLAAVEDLCRRLGSSPAGGAALLIDYGTDHPNADTLQAMQKHQFKHVLEQPGKVDLTTLVDFKSLRATVERTNKNLPSPLHVLPLVTQSHFLRNLNLAGRLEQLVHRALESGAMTEAEVETLISNAVRLVEPDRAKGGMGAHFKVMAIVSSALKQAENVPFNIPDVVMEEERRAHALAASKDQGPNQPTLPYAAPDAAPEHIFSTAPGETKPAAAASAAATKSATADASSLGSRIEARRAAAREAAAALAQARAARQAAEKQQP